MTINSNKIIHLLSVLLFLLISKADANDLFLSKITNDYKIFNNETNYLVRNPNFCIHHKTYFDKNESLSTKNKINDTASFLTLSLSTLSSNCNAVVIVPVKVAGFKKLLSIQTTLTWDNDKLSFQGIESYGPALLGITNANFGLNTASTGKLPFIWSASDVIGKTLSDSTILFSIRLGVRSGNASANVQFSNTPTPTEAVNEDMQVMNTRTNTGMVSINCSTSSNFTFMAPVISASCGSTVGVPVRIKNFRNILSLQGTFQWDATKMQYQGIDSYGPTSFGMGAGNFGISDILNGNLSFSWNDPDLSGETLTDSTILFMVRFYVIGNNVTSSYFQFGSLPTPLEVVNTSFNLLPIQAINGQCNISCNNITYRFTGNGNWNVSSNWINNTIPPSTLPFGSNIIIDPILTGECILNVSQTVSQGATFQVNAGKKLRILGNLKIQ
jgi:hypothetical protein